MRRWGGGEGPVTSGREPKRPTQVDKTRVPGGKHPDSSFAARRVSTAFLHVHCPPSPLPAVDNLVHVVLSGQPVGRRSCTGCRCHLLRSPSSFLALLPLLPLAVLRRRAQAAVRRPQVDAEALAALLLQVVLDALLPPLLLPGVLVALLEQVPGVVIQLHVQLVELLDALHLREGGSKWDVSVGKEISWDM